MKKPVLITALAAVIILVGLFALGRQTDAPTSKDTSLTNELTITKKELEKKTGMEIVEKKDGDAVNQLAPATDSTASENPAPKPRPKTVTVSYTTNHMFSPAMITVNTGDTVEFKNENVAAVRVSSDPHPFHTIYPALESGDLPSGATYQITLNEPMTIHYHNHLFPSVGGTITVE